MIENGEVGKIAVLRANGLGDLVFALPALEALREAFPQAEITLLGKPWHVDFFQGRPGPIDRVVPVPLYRGVREQQGMVVDPAEVERFFLAMRQECFDLAIQMHGGGRNSNPFTLRLGARATIGLKTPDAPPLDRWVPYIYFQSEIMRCLEVVTLVGAPWRYPEPHLAVKAQDLAETEWACPEDGQPLAALCPGATDPRRRWPPEKFAAVSDALAAAGARAVVTGVESERQITLAVVEAMHAPVLILTGRLTTGGLAGLLSRCRVVVSNDSGSLHLAGAVGAATVGIYWCGNLINADPVTRTRHRPMLSWRLECPVCGRNTITDRCEHAVSFVADVTTDEVIAQATGLLATP